IQTYLGAAAPTVAQEAMAAFDAAPDREAGLAAAREIVSARAPRALGAFPQPSPRYSILTPPAREPAAIAPYLNGERTLADGRTLYGLLFIRRDQAGDPVIEYWSVNLNHDEPTNIAHRAMRLEMQRDALAAQGLDPAEADRLQRFDPTVVSYDARAEGAQVTLRQRAQFYAALALAFVLWSVVFFVANMLLNGVIEEKSNKILDTLLTSVTPLEMLMGK